MKTIDHYLCRDCEQDLKTAGLIYKRVPGCEGEQPVCDFCRQRRFTAKYRIQYGRREK